MEWRKREMFSLFLVLKLLQNFCVRIKEKICHEPFRETKIKQR